MAVTLEYQGRVEEHNVNGIETSITYTGTKLECDTWAASQTIGATYAGLGKLVSMTVQQQGGSIYTVTAKYQNANGASGSTGQEVVPPDYTYGEFSATLDCTMLSSPLEQAKTPNGSAYYKRKWNNFLLARKAVGASAPPVPVWWSNAMLVDNIPEADQATYRWSESGSLPLEDGYIWFVCCEPTKPGVTSFDRCLYTQTESARFRSRADAIAAVASYAGRVGTPINNPGAPFVSGQWKCDRATVNWTGEYWLASLTWTYSPDGWDPDLYWPVSNS